MQKALPLCITLFGNVTVYDYENYNSESDQKAKKLSHYGFATLMFGAAELGSRAAFAKCGSATLLM